MFDAASNTADQVNTAFLVIVSISAVLLALVTFLMLFFVVRYNRKRHPKAEQIRGNIPLEILWTVVPTILVLIMFYYGWRGFDVIRHVPSDAMTVRVTGRMWSWSFEYENGMTSDTLYVPLDDPVRLAINSTDVIHSLYIPAFRIKEDAVPGMETKLWFTATEPGSYDLLCAEYCGLRHAYMLTKVVVLPGEEFSDWYEGAAVQPSPGTGTAGRGEALVRDKGCIACHSLDGTARVGPSFAGIFGRKTTVVTDGREREIIVDEDYLRRSILDPTADIVKGFPPVMPPQGDVLTDEELDDIIQYLKELGRKE
jgi:cytochrome c oxidase subunit 2